MKDVKPKKKKQKTPKQLKKILWQLCKQIIRKKYANSQGHWQCYTCSKLITENKDAHTGHFIPSSICGALLRYDIRNLRVQCYRCNIWLTGNGSQFYKNLVEKEGQEYVDELFKLKNQSIKADVIFYMKQITEKTALLDSLS